MYNFLFLFNKVVSLIGIAVVVPLVVIIIVVSIIICVIVKCNKNKKKKDQKFEKPAVELMDNKEKEESS